jgi:hypothetical protein
MDVAVRPVRRVKFPRVSWTARQCVCLAVKALVFVGLIAVAVRGGDWAVGALDLLDPAGRGVDPLADWRLWAAIAVYIALMAIPFCPGIELGLALMVIVGTKVVPLVYLATVFALLIAFAVGRFVPQLALIAIFNSLGMHRTRDMLARIEALNAEERLALLQGAGKKVQLLVRHRHLAVAVALNLPGNIALGDGGGIALAAGFSRLFSLPAFALTALIAVAPVPLAIAILGS